MFTRREIVAMNDVALELAFSGSSSRLRNAWARCQPGRLEDAFDVALILTEAAVRGLPVRPAGCQGQFRLFSV